jgi:hypothetical protein
VTMKFSIASKFPLLYKEHSTFKDNLDVLGTWIIFLKEEMNALFTS